MMTLASSISDECHLLMTLVIIYDRNMLIKHAAEVMLLASTENSTPSLKYFSAKNNLA
jgi:hypothetical protein